MGGIGLTVDDLMPLFPARKAGDRHARATVTAASPLRVLIDGDESERGAEATWPASEGDRVLCIVDASGGCTVLGVLGQAPTLPNGVYLRAEDADGTARNIAGMNSNGEVLLGYGPYYAGVGGTYLYGNEVGIRSKGGLTVTSPEAGLTRRAYGVNKVLWSGGAYMTASQTATLSEAVSAQPNGIVLVWSAYDGDSPQNSDWSYFFVPKSHVINHAGRGLLCGTPSPWGNMAKYVYVADTCIDGHQYNNASPAYGGITMSNATYVLRYVLGV